MDLTSRFELIALAGGASLVVALGLGLLVLTGGGSDSKAASVQDQISAAQENPPGPTLEFLQTLRDRFLEVAEQARLDASVAPDLQEPPARGVRVGTVVDVETRSLEIETITGDDYRFLITADTRIVRRGEDISPSDLEQGETVMVVSMDEGETAFGVYAFGRLATP